MAKLYCFVHFGDREIIRFFAESFCKLNRSVTVSVRFYDEKKLCLFAYFVFYKVYIVLYRVKVDLGVNSMIFHLFTCNYFMISESGDISIPASVNAALIFFTNSSA